VLLSPASSSGLPDCSVPSLLVLSAVTCLSVVPHFCSVQTLCDIVAPVAPPEPQPAEKPAPALPIQVWCRPETVGVCWIS
jgi:hypothetical protein